ncbi:transcriptional regulator [Aquimarina sp. BL5]|uniref:ArsR/SmtB family transcription factor n=1 Tax=Aquimarina sp. BL5 TaxID=1714860 RepID=UPI000E5447BE|nr:ArsR family transcriptional regulator [Aquimarina sp. BL5]AXT49553.1 transcriptional regulator [Aquimarina sp. BL5]RKM95700.1 ArsR family transcriptional regulator [Aquimarina sp. BL5]
MNKEKVLVIKKALANSTRLDILQWLKDPDSNFPPHVELGHFDFGVCGQLIQDKSGLSQPTISHYLATMHKAGLLIPTRHGKWTYFKRNEQMIQEYITEMKDNL